MRNSIELLIRLLKAFINTVLSKLTNCYLHKLLPIPAISLPPSENEGLNLFKHNIAAIMRLRSSGMGGCKSRNPIFPVTNRSKNITQREPLTLALFFSFEKGPTCFPPVFRFVGFYYFFLLAINWKYFPFPYWLVWWWCGGSGNNFFLLLPLLFFKGTEKRKTLPEGHTLTGPFAHFPTEWKLNPKDNQTGMVEAFPWTRTKAWYGVMCILWPAYSVEKG